MNDTPENIQKLANEDWEYTDKILQDSFAIIIDDDLTAHKKLRDKLLNLCKTLHIESFKRGLKQGFKCGMEEVKR